jgi:hypothetical protein
MCRFMRWVEGRQCTMDMGSLQNAADILLRCVSPVIHGALRVRAGYWVDLSARDSLSEMTRCLTCSRSSQAIIAHLFSGVIIGLRYGTSAAASRSTLHAVAAVAMFFVLSKERIRTRTSCGSDGNMMLRICAKWLVKLMVNLEEPHGESRRTSW